MITLKDANGQYVIISEDEFREAAMANLSTIYGMDLPTIAELRRQFQRYTGITPFTAENVIDGFIYLTRDITPKSEM